MGKNHACGISQERLRVNEPQAIIERNRVRIEEARRRLADMTRRETERQNRVLRIENLADWARNERLEAQFAARLDKIMIGTNLPT